MAFPFGGRGRSKEESGPNLTSVVISALTTTASQPLTCVKILIQVGHEPIAPIPTKTFFGKDVLRLPSLFTYAGHIRKVDGWTGLYRGLVPRIVSGVVSTIVNSAVLQSLEDNVKLRNISEDAVNENEEQEKFNHQTLKLLFARCAAVTLSHPFQVISVRMVVQFVGRETLYSGIVSSVKEIYNNEGILGFFVGLAPRLLAEVISLCIYRTLYSIIWKYAMEQELRDKKEVKVYVNGIAQYVAALITYPLALASNVVMVNHVGLAAGESPTVPVFTSWWDCFKYLRNSNNLWRGSSLFRRTAALPSTSV